MSTTGKFRASQEGVITLEKVLTSFGSIPFTQIVSKESALLPQTAQAAYFKVSGRVIVTQIVGEVTVELGAVATSIDLWSNPTVGADVALCTALVVTSDALGSVYVITGTITEAMLVATSGAITAQIKPILVTAGTIDLKASASNTGQTKWTLQYIPLDKGSSVIAL